MMPPTALFGSGTAPCANSADLPHGSVGEDDKCPICLDATAGSQIHVTTCAHRFHVSCYNQYRRSTMMKTRDQCPVCRTAQRDERRVCGSLAALRGTGGTGGTPHVPIPQDEGDADDKMTRGMARGMSRTSLAQDEADEDDKMTQNAYAHDADSDAHHPDTPLMLESHVNPITNRVLDKGSPLTGPWQKKGPGTTEERRAWRSQVPSSPLFWRAHYML